MINQIRESFCHTLEELWERLAPENPIYETAQRLLYRGQAEADWDLTPSILRTKLPPGIPELTSMGRLAEVECLLLSHFIIYCDRVALDTRCSASIRRKYMFIDGGIARGGPNQSREIFRRWPSKQIYELLALAQHHGLPTRLLDWTRRAHTAAYFAASGVVRSLREGHSKEGNFAVWVLDQDQFDGHKEEWATVRVPGSNSANLAAQEGEFTFRTAFHSMAEEQPSLALDAFFIKKEKSPLLKLIAPKRLAGDILLRCQQYGVAGVNLFPDYYGAVRSTLDLYSGI